VKQSQTFCGLTVSFIEGISAQEDADGALLLVGASGTLRLRPLTPAQKTALLALAAGESTEQELGQSVLVHEGMSAFSQFLYHYRQFVHLGLIQHTASCDGVRLATCVPLTPAFRFNLRELKAERYVLSRFAYCRKADGNLVIETPLEHARTVLHDWHAQALTGLLAQERRICELAQQLPGVTVDAAQDFIQVLLNAGALTECGADGKPDEDDTPALVQWNFHDLLFHSRSRAGRHSNPSGAAFRHLGNIKPLPVTKPIPPDAERIQLYKPDLTLLQETDAPFSKVLESRSSIRQFGKRPVNLQQLGEFLYRSARVRSVHNYEVSDEEGRVAEVLQISSRPYPAGGAIYELEVYVTANRCDGLSQGMYHYNPLEHTLYRIRDHNAAVEAMLNLACQTANINRAPDLLITLAARFQRISWKYESIAYATILKNVGVLYQTMYLVANAMGLAACALGNGNSDLFASAAGTDYYQESSVGDFMLGSLPLIEPAGIEGQGAL
jgi:SagB-type dehydrogenase family enzyme